MWISETKRKQYDMTPVSKSLASSGLLNAIETKQGTSPNYNYFHFLHKYHVRLGSSRKKSKGKKNPPKESRGRSPPEVESESDSDTEPLPKRKHPRRIGEQLCLRIDGWLAHL